MEEQAAEAQIPALDGYIGVLPGHAALISELKPVLSYHVGCQEKALAVYAGASRCRAIVFASWRMRRNIAKRDRSGEG